VVGGAEESAMAKLTHTNVWRAIDRTAEAHGLTASGLARGAGLDPTAFNKSKRLSPTQKRRWPSVETIAKVLNSVGDSIEEFVDRLNDHGRASRPRVRQPASRRRPRLR